MVDFGDCLVLTVKLSFLFLLVNILFSVPMIVLYGDATTFKGFSIFLWMQVSAIIFSTNYVRLGLLWIVDFFPPSLVNSACLETDLSGQGVVFGVITINVLSSYLMIFYRIYFHHSVRAFI